MILANVDSASGVPIIEALAHPAAAQGIAPRSKSATSGIDLGGGNVV